MAHPLRPQRPPSHDDIPGPSSQVRGLIRFAIWSGLTLVSGFLLMITWQYSFHEVFGLPELRYYQALAFSIFFRVLLGYPEYARAIHRNWLKEQQMRQRAFLQHLFITYLAPKDNDPKDNDPQG